MKVSREQQAKDREAEDALDRQRCVEEWPTPTSFEEKKALVSEFLAKTSVKALSRTECSFCGHAELVSDVTCYPTAELDVSRLVHAVVELRLECTQPAMVPLHAHGDKYDACRPCSSCITYKKFTRIPPNSYANGCWIGARPAELKGLTYVEELLLGRARATKCWAKLNEAGQQRAGSGNVCLCE